MISGSLKKSGRKLRKFLESNENGSTTYQNLWDSSKTVLRGKCLAMSAYSKTIREISNKLPNDAPQTLTK
jgi:hypothetical protein